MLWVIGFREMLKEMAGINGDVKEVVSIRLEPSPPLLL